MTTLYDSMCCVFCGKKVLDKPPAPNKLIIAVCQECRDRSKKEREIAIIERKDFAGRIMGWAEEVGDSKALISVLETMSNEELATFLRATFKDNTKATMPSYRGE